MRQRMESLSGVVVSSLAYDFPPACRVPEHSHGWDQVVYAISGVMEVRVGRNFWLIPPQFALWMPAGVRHRIRMAGAVCMRTLYLRLGTAEKMPEECAVLHVAPLLRELIMEAARLGQLRSRTSLHVALKKLIVASLHSSRRVPTRLAFPEDHRAAAVATAAMAEPVNNMSFNALCEEAGASTRTIQRIFLRQVGSNFETWRRQARLMKAIELLVGGCSVKETSARVGYQHTGAFITLFRTTFGKTPKAWIAGELANGPAKVTGNAGNTGNI